MAGVVGFEPTPYGFEDRHTTNYTKPLFTSHLLHNYYIINFNKNQIKEKLESICGLEIKSPECLKDLAEDCVIFICNIYYREIQQQLRDMGIKNQIEFFNDEYMPSFQFK